MSRSAFPASFAQQRLWFLDQLEPGTAAYNLCRVFRIDGPLNVAAFQRALEAIIHRHSALRTVFDSVEGDPRQVILSDPEVRVPTVDISDLPEQEKEEKAIRIASEEAKKPFHLSEGPLVRTTLIQLAQEKYILVLVMHHIVTDGWSISILFRELTQLYSDLARNLPSSLPPAPIQYVDYAQWQRENMSGQVLENEVRHWKQKLAGAQTLLDLPTDYTRPSSHSWHGATEGIVFSGETLRKVKALARDENATPFMVTLAGFQALLHRYSGQESVLVGTPVAARNEVEIEQTIGLFVNTLVFRGEFQRGLSFLDLLRQTRSYALEAYAHQDVPFEKLVEELVPQRSLDTHPLFQVMFVFQNIPKQVFKIPGLTIEEIPFDAGIAKFDLSAELWDDGQLHCQFEYNTDIFEMATIRRMLGHFEHLLTAAVESPETPVDSLPLMGSEERRQVLVDWNQTAAEYPREATIHQVFEQQAGRSPEATALIDASRNWTFREINLRANRLAHALMSRGIGPGARVGIYAPRSAEMVIALLGTLKSGAAYVPLDPAFPAERLEFIVEDAKLSAIVTNTQVEGKLFGRGCAWLTLSDDSGANEAAGNPNVPLSSDKTAYVIYTSGSTGNPKGVEGTHRASLNRFAWMWREYPFQAGEVCCQKTNLGFVDSIWEIFGPLLQGISNVIIPEDAVRDPEMLLDVLTRERVTRIVLVPSLLRALLEFAPNLQEVVPELQLWSCSGEVLPVGLAKQFRESYPRATLLNVYGSSEVAADVTWHCVSERDFRSSVAIGKPISNTQIYLVDEQRNVVPAGLRGQIYVGGDGLARGYLNRPELTGESFVANWIDPAGSARLYRTGDVGRFRPSGELEYVGRVDHQVKIRGQRIELGEIEAVLATHPAIHQGVVAVIGQNSHQRLSAFLVGKLGERLPLAGEIRQHLRARLPESMIPGSYWQIEAVPLLSSGKVNRAAVASLPATALLDGEQVIEPRNEVEAKLAEIWCELLKTEKVGVEQNFFELGGHSLLVLQAAARIRRVFEVELPVRSVFESPTIAGLAQEIEKARALGLTVKTPGLQKRPRASGGMSREALLAQLDGLSASELQSLLQRVLDRKQPA